MSLISEHADQKEFIPWKNLRLKNFTTSDNGRLFYYGRLASNKVRLGTILLLVGWSEGPNNYSPFLSTNTFVKENYDVYLLVMRGFNNLEDNFNNNLARYSKDVVEFIHSKKLKNINAIGHGMGASLVMNIIGVYGEKYFNSYVFVDMAVRLLKNPNKFGSDLRNDGALYSSDELYSFYNTSAESAIKSAEKRSSYQQTLVTPQFLSRYPKVYIKMLAGTLGYNYKVANEILIDYVYNDNEQLLRNKLTKPALLIGGKASIIPYETVNFQKDFFELATVKIFEESEGGSHLMYIENYELFNTTLNDFLKTNNNVVLRTQRRIKSRINKGIKKAGTAVLNAVVNAIIPG